MRLILGFIHDLISLPGEQDAYRVEEPQLELRRHLLEFADLESPGVVLRYEKLVGEEDDSLPECRMEYLARIEDMTETTPTSIFITSTGKVGLGPRGLKDGDHITVFYGCGIPFVVRQEREWNGMGSLVGPCYLRDVMYGQALENSSGEPVSFCLW